MLKRILHFLLASSVFSVFKESCGGRCFVFLFFVFFVSFCKFLFYLFHCYFFLPTEHLNAEYAQADKLSCVSHWLLTRILCAKHQDASLVLSLGEFVLESLFYVQRFMV